MHIIPVIDLKDSRVVSAQQGQRERYQPIQSALSHSSLINDIIEGFLNIYPFKTLYIADLNAITATGDNQSIINKVIAEYPQIEFWVDSGLTIQQTQQFSAANYKLIIGSESQNIPLTHPANIHFNQHILSLDFFPDKGYIGPNELLNQPQLWPQNVIIMTLDRVGKNIGPDFQRLKQFCQQHPKHHIIAAGGIRDPKDLIKLKAIGVKYALIASALHTGKITKGMF